jgi:glycosyltransferase involved in cell wall biosynthesis
METVHNGIDLPAQRNGGALRAELGIPEQAPLAGEIARLCDVKGQRELIRAASQVPELRVVLVGEDLEAGGAFRTGLEREAGELGVGDRVHFTGYRADAQELLDDLDVFVLPSWIEGLPLTVLEAMARGKPVVATPVGGTPELVVDGETGLLVPPRDAGALADALRSLAADPERAQALGAAGRARVAERFSSAAMTGRVLAVYDEVVSRKKVSN